MGTDSIKNRPKFVKLPEDHQHFVELRSLVNERVRELPKHRLVIARVRAVVLVLMYIILYFKSLQFQAQPGLFYLMYFLLGVVAVLIFLNIIHETCHGNLFKSFLLNKVFYSFFDLMGMNSYIWKKRHNILHHNYPNLAGWDSDIEQSGPIKIYPHGEKKPEHRYQHYFIFLLYPVYLLNWVIVRDFKDYFKDSQIVRKICSIPVAETVKLIFFKLFFLFYILIVPWKFYGFSFGQSLTAMMILLSCAGVFSLAVLLTPHVNTGNNFPLMNADNTMPQSWLINQLITTNDVSADNFLTRHVMGNFNYHVAHHLFPNVSSVYAPEVTQVIREYALTHQLPYRSISFAKALKTHYDLLKKNAVS